MLRLHQQGAKGQNQCVLVPFKMAPQEPVAYIWGWWGGGGAVVSQTACQSSQLQHN